MLLTDRRALTSGRLAAPRPTISRPRALLVFDRRRAAGPLAKRSEISELEHQGRAAGPRRIRLLRL